MRTHTHTQCAQTGKLLLVNFFEIAFRRNDLATTTLQTLCDEGGHTFTARLDFPANRVDFVGIQFLQLARRWVVLIEFASICVRARCLRKKRERKRNKQVASTFMVGHSSQSCATRYLPHEHNPVWDQRRADWICTAISPSGKSNVRDKRCKRERKMKLWNWIESYQPLAES